MIYYNLASYYDELVRDYEYSKKWADFTKNNISGNKILELASGSGEITNILYKYGYDILASDLSLSMLKRLNDKYPYIKTKQIDMIKFSCENKYDGIICYCDSINYLNSLDECKNMFISVYNALKDGGTFIFDMHTEDRLIEFKDEFIEEGYITDVPYQWTINTIDDEIHHHFAFYTKEKILQEYHVQKVFKLEDIIKILNEVGFNIKVYTDFDYEGIINGEKYFIVGGKV